MSECSDRIAFAWSPMARSIPRELWGEATTAGHTLYTVPISPRLEDGEHCILLSMAASPGRYLEALYRRAIELAAPRRAGASVILLNPSSFAFPMGTLCERIQAIAKRARSRGVGPEAARIWEAKGSSRPLAYEIPFDLARRRPEAVRGLRHLSTLDPETDSELLTEICGLKTSICVADLEGGTREALMGSGGSAFLDPAVEPMHLAQARSLLRAIDLRGLQKALEDPLFVMPYEAGDLLFFCIALKQVGMTKPSILALAEFAPIILKVLPEARIVRFYSPLPGSARKELSEIAYFQKYILTSIPTGRSFTYLRPSRSVWSTQAHLADQFRFALGTDLRSEAERISYRALSKPAPPKKAEKGQRPRVLLHFEGGWKLKHYPQPWRRRLIELMRAKGFEPAVLTDQELPKAECVPFKSLSELESLLKRCDLVVAVDSFPAHFASWMTDVPTLTLFGSTRSSCAHVPEKNRVLALERGIDCNPCGGVNACSRYFEPYCLNYPDPDEVMAALEDSLKS